MKAASRKTGFRKLIFVLTGVLILLLLASSAQAVTKQWTGAVDNNWATVNNWVTINPPNPPTPGPPPGPGDDALVT